ncbi:hypothetical protein PENFLA_c041G01942 [Penicillium flavigenum]|uniref:FAD-binding PCMH-type domain-containing protein n=1 Tax=Penicillium flavigenum TaxID=254877 RepID=A0A1V6SKB2_9EURO|nr:hypothetical protein PENFLA_c041G01942 [Penicillium flavigenum]
MKITWKDSGDKASYDLARFSRVFNLRRPNHFPRAVIDATCAGDVVAGVKLAIQQSCQVAVRSGGHSMFGWSLQNDSLLIDLGNWKEVVVEADSSVAKVTPSTTGEALNNQLQAYGLMFPTGHCPSVGLGGFLLQGGQGWNCRNWGLACEKIIAVEVVTAQGELLLCNNKQNAELYWAARGSGPLFPAIVTRFHLQLLPYPSSGFLSSAYVYPSALYRRAFEWVQSMVPEADEDTEIIMTAFYPDSEHEVCLKLHFVTMKSDATAAENALLKLHQSRPSGALRESVCQKESLTHLYEEQAMANPDSHYYHTDNAFLADTANVTDVLRESILGLPRGKSYAFWYPMYPRSQRAVSDMALSVPSNHYFAIYTISESKNTAAQSSKWVDMTMEKINEHAVGSYVGECELKLPHEWYWKGQNAQRIEEVRQKWDPNSLFCAAHECDSQRA